MSDVSAFLDFMPHTVTQNAFVRRGTDGYGGPAYSTVSASYSARVVAKPTIIVRPDGMELLATHTMWLGTTGTVNQEDKITYAGSTYQILEVARFPDQFGALHVRLMTRG